MKDSKYIAVDLGAESGRVMVGHVEPGKIRLAEAHRFPNVAVKVGNTWHWDILRLWHEIQTGIGKVAPYEKFDGIGVDTWGVDFGLLGEDGTLLGNPVCYRDDRTKGMDEKVFARIPREKLYALTGIQSIFFNTLYQVASLSLNSSPALQHAKHLLFTPDLINYWLSGHIANEYTIASTSQMLDAKARTWCQELLLAIGVPRTLFPELVMPATWKSKLGTVQANIGDAIGATGIPVIAVGSHDTASAVAAIPATGEDWLFLSSGTWSLLGVEVDQPVLTPKAAAYNLTNEGGVGGKIRLLKNIAGLWLVQECRRAWAKQGKEYDYATLTQMAAAAEAGVALIDPDDASFSTPGDMPEKIAAYCRKTGQRVPKDHGTIVRVCLESLAATYAKVKAMLEDVTGRHFSRLHIVGGGSQNDLLNQLAADATGLNVHAGPVEATALGNIMAQAIATGNLDSIHAGRQLIAQSVEPKVFVPRGK